MNSLLHAQRCKGYYYRHCLINHVDEIALSFRGKLLTNFARIYYLVGTELIKEQCQLFKKKIIGCPIQTS